MTGEISSVPDGASAQPGLAGAAHAEIVADWPVSFHPLCAQPACAHVHTACTPVAPLMRQRAGLLPSGGTARRRCVMKIPVIATVGEALLHANEHVPSCVGKVHPHRRGSMRLASRSRDDEPPSREMARGAVCRYPHSVCGSAHSVR